MIVDGILGLGLLNYFYSYGIVVLQKSADAFVSLRKGYSVISKKQRLCFGEYILVSFKVQRFYF
jgi:hypothetical protein